jgi:hypothetical protein
MLDRTARHDVASDTSARSLGMLAASRLAPRPLVAHIRVVDATSTTPLARLMPP